MESLPWPNIGLGSGWTLVAFFVWQLYTGRAASGREIREKSAANAELTAANRELRHMLRLVLTETMTTISPVLSAMRSAFEAEDEEAGP